MPGTARVFAVSWLCCISAPERVWSGKPSPWNCQDGLWLHCLDEDAGNKGGREVFTGSRIHNSNIDFESLGLHVGLSMARESGWLTAFQSLWLSLDGVLNHCGGMKEFDFLEERLSDMVMHVLRKLYREKMPRGAALMCCAACTSALEIFCSQGLLGKYRLNLTRNVPEPRIGCPTWGILRGGD